MIKCVDIKRLGFKALSSITVLCAAGSLFLPTVSSADAESDWVNRSTGPDVVRAMRFDTYDDYYNGVFNKQNPGNNAYDETVKASGGGSLRFDVLSQTGEGGGGNWVMNFSEDFSVQFGANEEFWVQWRQRFDPFIIEHDYRETSGWGEWKQVIISQGDTNAYTAYACTEREIVVQNQSNRDYPSSYMECGAYDNFSRYFEDTNTFTRQNARNHPNGTTACQYFPSGGDESGCLKYYPNEWMTFMVHITMGPEGEAYSSAAQATKKGLINSSFELYVAREGQPLQLAHRQENLVIPKGQHWNPAVGVDPDAVGDPGYYNGWGPHDAHPDAKYGKLWFTPYHTHKDWTEVHEAASIWYDEVIVSRSRIPDPGGVSIYAEPSTVQPGGTAVLTWTTSNNPASCSASDAWLGARPANGSLTLTNISATSTYTLTCDGLSNSATISVDSGDPGPDPQPEPDPEPQPEPDPDPGTGGGGDGSTAEDGSGAFGWSMVLLLPLMVYVRKRKTL